MNRLLSLTGKDLRLLVRDKMALFWVLVFPLVFGLFFGILSGGGAGEHGKVSMAIVDQDDTPASHALIEKLAKSESLDLKSAQALGCEKIDEACATNAVRLGKLSAFVVLPRGFSESLLDFSGRSAAIKLGSDPARKAESGLLQGIVMEAAYSLMGQQMSDPNQMEKQVDRAREQIAGSKDMGAVQKATLLGFLGALNDFTHKWNPKDMPAQAAFGANLRIEPLAIAADQNGPRSAFEITFPSAVLWAILGCMISFAVSIVVERRQGTLLRLRVSPLTGAQILAGKGTACYIASIASAGILLTIGTLFMHVRVSNAFYLILAVVCTAFCFVGIMALISMLGKTEQAVGGAGTAIMMGMAMLGGGMIPLFVMPSWMQMVSNISPVKWGIVALEGSIWRGFSLTEMLLPCAILVTIGCVGFGLGLWGMQRMAEEA